jgi:hypothetical protein
LYGVDKAKEGPVLDMLVRFRRRRRREAAARGGTCPTCSCSRSTSPRSPPSRGPPRSPHCSLAWPPPSKRDLCSTCWFGFGEDGGARPLLVAALFREMLPPPPPDGGFVDAVQKSLLVRVRAPWIDYLAKRVLLLTLLISGEDGGARPLLVAALFREMLPPPPPDGGWNFCSRGPARPRVQEAVLPVLPDPLVLPAPVPAPPRRARRAGSVSAKTAARGRCSWRHFSARCCRRRLPTAAGLPDPLVLPAPVPAPPRRARRPLEVRLGPRTAR